MYAFVLGRIPEISIAELGCFLEPLRILKNSNVAIYEEKLSYPPQEFLNRLGGIVEIIELFKNDITPGEVESAIEQYLRNTCSRTQGKCSFAINLVPEKKKSNTLKFLLPRIKKALRNASIKANFMNKDFRNVSMVLASKQRLVESRTNISIIEKGEGKISIGYSVALQDFEGYSKRDYGKPFRDPQSGMLPPKLAQMMINLGYEEEMGKKEMTILDPFCGSGTILMEALLMGYSVIGSDSKREMVEGASKNIEWLRKNFKVPVHASSKIFHSDAINLPPSFPIPHSTFLSIVTEPYLGPPLSSFPAETFLQKLIIELSTLYLNFFTHLRKIIHPKIPIVCIFPYYRKPDRESMKLSEALIDKIEALGYSKLDSFFYDRPNQVVGREIVRFILGET